MTLGKHWVLALAFVVSACSSHFDTSKREGATGYTIYRISQEQAFSIAYNSILTVLPGRKISEIEGPVKGYSTWSRFVLDTYTQQVTVVPARGTTSAGQVVEGFYFEVSGSGTSGTGYGKNVTLYETIQQRLDQLNVGVKVSRLERGSYTEPVFATEGQPAAPAPRPSVSVEDRLKELKRLRDGGLISAAEYEAQRAKIIGSL